MQINLWDFNFRQSECSTAFQKSQHIQYVRDQTEWDGITLFTDGYVFDGTVDKVKSKYKIAWLRESQCLWPKHYENMPKVASKFDKVFSYYEELRILKNAEFVPYGGVWVPRERFGIHPKRKLISMLYSGKQRTEGHQLRHDLAGAIVEAFGADLVDFYGYRGMPADYGPHTKLRILKDYMFSIAIQACREDNLFSEVLLDCFALGTIPIYWGAPNIGDFFNEEGILPFTRISECLDLIEFISKQGYQEMQPAVEENLKAAAEYVTAEDWMYEHGRFSFG